MTAQQRQVVTLFGDGGAMSDWDLTQIFFKLSSGLIEALNMYEEEKKQ